MIYESGRIRHSGFWKHLFFVRVFPGFSNQFNVEEAPVWFDGRRRIHNGAGLMHEFDVTIKLLLLRAAKLTVRELTGTDIGKWLDVELPKVQNRRLDLLGEAIDGSLVHLELQSGNDPSMPLRMAEYCLGVYRLYGKFPRQILLYVGKAPLRMDSEFRGPDVSFRYRAVTFAIWMATAYWRARTSATISIGDGCTTQK